MHHVTVQVVLAGQGLAGRRDEPLLCAISISHQQNADCYKNPIHEGRPLRMYYLLHLTPRRLINNCGPQQAVKIALEVKKYLIDNDQFDVSQV